MARVGTSYCPPLNVSGRDVVFCIQCCLQYDSNDKAALHDMTMCFIELSVLDVWPVVQKLYYIEQQLMRRHKSKWSHRNGQTLCNATTSKGESTKVIYDELSIPQWHIQRLRSSMSRQGSICQGYASRPKTSTPPDVAVLGIKDLLCS